MLRFCWKDNLSFVLLKLLYNNFSIDLPKNYLSLHLEAIKQLPDYLFKSSILYTL